MKLETTLADKEMALIRSKGFTQMISGANPVGPYNLRSGLSDDEAKKHGFDSAQALLNAVWKAVDDHAVQADWVPVATNPADAYGVLVLTNTPNPGTNNFWRIRSVP